MVNKLPPNGLPAEGVLLFHRLTCWHQNNPKTTLRRLGTRLKKLQLLKIVRPKIGEELTAPEELSPNTLYFPANNKGIKAVIRDIRNAFCHDSIRYDEESNQYIIRKNEKVKLDASFSLEAINELGIFFKK